MRKRITTFIVGSLLIAGAALADDATPRVEWFAFPGGGLFFKPTSDSHGLSSFALGTSFALRVSPRVAVEPEVVFGVGLRETIDFKGRTLTAQPMPDTIGYTANVIVNTLPRTRGAVPYLAGGGGALLVVPRGGTEALDITDKRAMPAANLGGGMKWYAASGWGIRVDYRVVFVGHVDEMAPLLGERGRIGQRFAIGGFTMF